jgi:hypothetical protein
MVEARVGAGNDTTEFKAEQSRVLGSDCKLDKISSNRGALQPATVE